MELTKPQPQKIKSQQLYLKADFEKIIFRDQQYHEALIKLRNEITRKQSTLYIANKFAKESYEWARLEVERYEVEAKINIQARLVHDKLTHFHEVFLPNYQLELDAAKKYFDKTLEAAKTAVKNSKNDYTNRIQSLIDEYEIYQSRMASEKVDEEKILEVKSQYYKMLKRLLFLNKSEQKPKSKKENL